MEHPIEALEKPVLGLGPETRRSAFVVEEDVNRETSPFLHSILDMIVDFIKGPFE